MTEVSELLKGIPVGKTRVVGVDLFSSEDYLVKDCDTAEEAFNLADERNKERKDSMEDVCYVYNDSGTFVRGPEAVKKETMGLGVSP